MQRRHVYTFQDHLIAVVEIDDRVAIDLSRSLSDVRECRDIIGKTRQIDYISTRTEICYRILTAADTHDEQTRLPSRQPDTRLRRSGRRT